MGPSQSGPDDRNLIVGSMPFKFVKFKRKARNPGPLAALAMHCLTYGQASVNKAIPRAPVIATDRRSATSALLPRSWSAAIPGGSRAA